MTHPRSELSRRIGNHPSLPLVRAVWAEVTRTPHATCRELAARLHYSHSMVAAALRWLYYAGYIEQPYRQAARARRVIVPCV